MFVSVCFFTQSYWEDQSKRLFRLLTSKPKNPGLPLLVYSIGEDLPSSWHVQCQSSLKVASLQAEGYVSEVHLSTFSGNLRQADMVARVSILLENQIWRVCYDTAMTSMMGLLVGVITCLIISHLHKPDTAIASRFICKWDMNKHKYKPNWKAYSVYSFLIRDKLVFLLFVYITCGVLFLIHGLPKYGCNIYNHCLASVSARMSSNGHLVYRLQQAC